ncbi:MAG TPA: isoprenyl transferase [Candidatus Sulfotelmatobacter sp.]|jgi:undecaprenyl diphosphate synthase|nr:isoprenyl transferase [Candidatus Sulfotelmatobacter sp.]
MEAASSPQTGSAPPPPVHIAVIMDGNGRWAKARGLPRVAGHRQGAEAVRACVRAAGELGVSYLTLFGFSSENWKRPDGEVHDLMGLLRLYLRNEVRELHKNNVRLRVVGDRQRLGADIVALIDHAEEKTGANTGLTLTLALSYGGRAEIVHAARVLAEKAAAGEISPAALDEETFAAALFTAGMPDPDLLIRTSGEQRISNFLLWQCAYAEMVFTDVLWPDFDRCELEKAILAFHGRDRRYGTVR